MTKLSTSIIESAILKEPKKIADGNGLYFVKPARGQCYWVSRYTFQGARKQTTLGSYPTMGLEEARIANQKKQKDACKKNRPSIPKRSESKAGYF